MIPVSITLKTKYISSNLKIIQNIAPKSYIWSVIKANAYGHNLNFALKGLNKTNGFALINIKDAIILRNHGWKGPILLLEGFFNHKEIHKIHHYNLIPVIHNEWQVEKIKTIIPKYPLNIYLKLNTGMNRLGFHKNIFISKYQELKSIKHISKITLMTHFASNANKHIIKKQMKIVTHITKKINIIKCLANSAAILLNKSTHKNWIRPGILLYGIPPHEKFQKTINKLKFKPVMTLNSRIIAIQTVKQNERIGYEWKYKIQKKQQIGIVSCGYSDGYPYNAPTGTPVLVDGIRTKIIGPVTMNMLTVDLTPCPVAKIGSLVELWGEKIKISEIAKISNTSSYKIISSLSSKIPKKIT